MAPIFTISNNHHRTSCYGSCKRHVALVALLAAGAANGINTCVDSTSSGRQFKCGADVTTVNLSSCGLTDADSVDIGPCFDNAGRDSIKIIYLTDNSLTTLPADLFEDLGALEALYIGKNPFTVLPAGLFHGLQSLTRLWINGSQLDQLEVGILDDVVALQHLYLHNNNLSSLDDSLLNTLQDLQIFDVRGNNLETLPLAVFGNEALRSLHTLNLSGNDISSLPLGGFGGLTGLLNLYLSDNPLGTTLAAGTFAGLEALETLTLSNTQLETLQAGLFDGLIALEILTTLISVAVVVVRATLQQERHPSPFTDPYPKAIQAKVSLSYCKGALVESPALAVSNVLLPAGFDTSAVCSCPGEDICSDCLPGENGLICTGCEDAADTCAADRECQECRLEATSEEQLEWESCLASYEYAATCSAVSSTSCCFDVLSPNDCLANPKFVSYSECVVQAASEQACSSLSCRHTETMTTSTSETSAAGSGKRPLSIGRAEILVAASFALVGALQRT
ncbi:unnamed protein product [Ectocarpus sp. 12 AP-2014]